jgi:hypothetical protein
MLNGDVVPAFTPDLANAMEILIHADDTPETVRIIGEVIKDPWRSAAERAVAATLLGRSTDSTTPGILSELLDIEDTSVQIQVVKSLAAVGTPDQLAPLREIDAPPGSPLHKQATFARDVIAHRAGMEIEEPIQARGIKRESGEPEEMIDLTFRPITKKKLANDRDKLDGPIYNMPIADKGFRLTAGKAEWSVLTNAEMSEAGGFGAMFQRPWLTALLARIEPRTTRSNVQYVVLSHPSGRGARINVFRTDGELMYTGSMKRAKDLLEFSMRDVARKATAPTNVSGRITKQGPVLITTVPFGSRHDQRTGHEGVPL